MTLKSPYPYFGGKSTIASEVWKRFGDASNYVEPFFGSGAVLLARPHKPDLELVNDIDGYVVNFWRAVQADAEAVAEHADYPAFENDLHARHAWLVSRKDSLREKLEGDPAYYDAQIAGWWVWGMSLWIGSGFCSGKGGWVVEEGRLVNRKGDDAEVSRKLPHLSSAGMGIWRVRPDLTSNGQGIRGGAIVRQLPRPVSVGIGASGVARQLPTLTVEQGVHRKRLHLMSQKGVQRKLPESVSARGEYPARRAGLYAYFADLQARFSRVRVVCGDWTRVTSPAVLGAKSPCAIFLDPPYTPDGREADLYNHDSQFLHLQVRQWAIENGANPDYRIAYCGYDDDFSFPPGWEKLAWKANGGYSNQGEGRKANASREVIYFSPGCLKPETQMSMFEALP